MPSRDWALALTLAALTVVTRWPYRTRLLPTWDAVQFGLALERFDVVRHQPHPPGYILYVALARLAAPLFGDPAATLTGLAVGASALAVLLVYRLGYELDGRGAAALAALGLAASPLFWAYAAMALPYAAEAALATAVALAAWGMRAGRMRSVVASALLLGLAGGVRQSLLVVLGPLWLGMAWRSFRRPGPILGGLGLVVLVTMSWLLPMVWLTGAERYVSASLELYASTVRATTLLGGGAARNLAGLGEALLVGVGLFLPVLLWTLHPAPLRSRDERDRAWLFGLWTLPALTIYGLVHLGQHGYLLTVLPACYLLVGRMLAAFVRGAREAPVRPRLRSALACAAIVAVLGAHAAFIAAARPVDVPLPGGSATWQERVGSDLRALYRFRLWSHTAGGLREREAVIGGYVDAIRREFDPRTTVLVTELGNPRSYPWFRHVAYYLPEFPVYHLRLGEPRPGYLASRELDSMAAVPAWLVPLPLAMERLVWVVDEWHPGLPPPAGLERRPVSHGRSLYTLRVHQRAVDHAGYHLVPVSRVARLP